MLEFPKHEELCDVDISLSFYLIFHSPKYDSCLAYVPSVFSLATAPMGSLFGHHSRGYVCCVPAEGITIVFGNAIRMSADSLIAPADTLIVVKATIRIVGIYG